MSQTWMPFCEWLARTALGGGAVLMAAWVLMRCTRQPVRQLRIGVVGVGSALLLSLLSIAPAWLLIPVSWRAEEASSLEKVPASAPPPLTLSQGKDEGGRMKDEPEKPADSSFILHPSSFILPEGPVAAPEESRLPEPSMAAAAIVPPWDLPRTAATPASDSGASPGSSEVPWGLLVSPAVVSYFAVAALLLVRLLLGLAAPWWIMRGARSPAPEIQELFTRVLADGRRPRLLVSRRLVTPMSCGLFRPTVVLPAFMIADPDPQRLRWVLAHELAHLRRRDPWICLLFGLGAVVFFFVPWFWSLRRQVRLCQEYLADDCAAQDSPPEDYAQFLLSLSAAPALPAGVFGVSGNSSDLFRRVTMLLGFSERFEKRCPRLWALSLGSGLLALAVLISGIGLQADAAPVPAQEKEEAKKEEPKKAETPKAEPKKAAEPLFRKATPPGVEPEVAAVPDGVPGGGDITDHMKQMQKQQAQMMRKMMRGMRGGPMGGGMGGFDNHMFPERGRLGVIIDEPSATLISQLDLPKGQGLVIEEIQNDSPAAKAGLKAHDIILEFDGKPVPSEAEEFSKIVTDVKAKTPVDALVLRKGKKETIKGITLAQVKEVAAPGGFAPFPGAGLAPGFPGAVPAFPAVRAEFPLIPGGGLGFGAGAGNGVMTTTFRNNDSFTTRHQEGSLVITVTGKVTDGKAKVNEIKVQDGTENHKYETVDKVAEQYRDKVKNLVEMSEKGSVKIEIKQP